MDDEIKSGLNDAWDKIDRNIQKEIFYAAGITDFKLCQKCLWTSSYNPYYLAQLVNGKCPYCDIDKEQAK